MVDVGGSSSIGESYKSGEKTETIDMISVVDMAGI